jgi:hypothetical protein
MRPFVLFVVGPVLFAIAYCQAPLYYSNQNQYFLHGLADGGFGSLRNDWLANTRDSTPLFSALVDYTVRYLHPWAFYVEYGMLLAVYAAALLGLFTLLVGEPIAGRRWPIFLALFLAIHSALARWCSYHWLGQDYPWFLQAGLAGQYILGSMFQPSSFGVLLVVAICLFARGHTYLAAVSAALAAVMHSTYLLPAAMLVVGMMLALLQERRPGRALGVGAVALALVLPVIVYILRTFAPTSATTFAESQRILVDIRIPHHTRPDRWIDTIGVLQMLWVVLAIPLARVPRLRYPLAVSAVLALLLTLAQVATGSHTLALLFPWRVSSVLVPVATTIILSRLVGVLPTVVDGAVASTAAVVVVMAAVLGGLWITVERLGFQNNDDELTLLNYVRDHHEPGDVYLLPVNIPNLTANARGTPSSSDFKPLVVKKHDDQVIPVDLQRFRLYTGVPIFVDFKSIPYKDTEVLEWYTRLKLAKELEEQLKKGDVSNTLTELRRHGITHVVVSAGQQLEGDGLEKIYEDKLYRIYRLNPAS